ncbi:MAG: Ig-like domain-containing protein, partial [Limisphaerales bacterium]
TSSVATVTLTVNNFPVANNDSYRVAENTILTVGPPGILANDTGGSGSLSAILVSGPSNGTLTLTNNGGFGYAPANNYVGSDSFTYQATDGISTSSVATVAITVTVATTANNDIYGMTPGTILNVPTPGVLANDVGGGGSLTALLASAPLHGILNLTNGGGFSYQPTNNFTGIDDFTYQATDGVTTSAVAAVAIEVMPVGKLLADNFSRSLLWPWIQQSGTSSLANDALLTTSAANSYAFAYISNNWTDYTVQGQVQFSTTSAWGGGIGGRLNPTTGAHYAAWVYPEGSQGDDYPNPPTGLAVLKLIKFKAWGGDIGSTYTIMGQTNLPNVGKSWHTVEMAFQGTNIVVSYDGALEINTSDSASYTTGGINVGLYSDATLYTFSVSNVMVAPLVANDSYSTTEDTTLSVAAPGVLGNDTDVYGTGLTAVLISGPSNGSLTLTNNGGLSYTPTGGFVGTDSFVYQANDGTINLGTATVTITVVAPAGSPTPHEVRVGVATVAPGVLLSNLVYAKGVFRLSVPTEKGRSYILEFTDSLSPANWTALPSVAGDGTVNVLVDPAATNQQRFYRVHVR